MSRVIETKVGVVELHLRGNGKSFWCSPAAEVALSSVCDFYVICSREGPDGETAVFLSDGQDEKNLVTFKIQRNWQGEINFPYPSPPEDFMIISIKELEKMKNAVMESFPPDVLEKLVSNMTELETELASKCDNEEATKAAVEKVLRPVTVQVPPPKKEGEP